jgi:two-component system, chemotaxis family, response regulator PixH
MTTILIVEDTMSQAEIIGKILRQGGYTTVIVTTSEDAKSHLQNQTPDAIVMDVVLPGLSGFELCRELKEEPSTMQIPIVMCSTKDSEMDRFWGMKQGAANYLTKPIDAAALLRAVQALVQP